jgi:hypothetical protein
MFEQEMVEALYDAAPDFALYVGSVETSTVPFWWLAVP